MLIFKDTNQLETIINPRFKLVETEAVFRGSMSRGRVPFEPKQAGMNGDTDPRQNPRLDSIWRTIFRETGGKTRVYLKLILPSCTGLPLAG